MVEFGVCGCINTIGCVTERWEGEVNNIISPSFNVYHPHAYDVQSAMDITPACVESKVTLRNARPNWCMRDENRKSNFKNAPKVEVTRRLVGQDMCVFLWIVHWLTTSLYSTNLPN